MAAISFADRVAIVTGAGGGIGRQHALELGRRGARVLVNDLGCDPRGSGDNGDTAEAVAREIRAAGGMAVANRDSVATTAGAEAMVAQALAAFGRVDVLINNAGVMRSAFLEDTSDDDWDALIATHLTGSFKVTRAVWPHMKARRYGRVVFTASSSGAFGIMMQAGYAAAKAGVMGLMNVAALEGEPHGILCNAIMPFGLTRMAEQSARDFAQGGLIDDDFRMPADIGNGMNPEFNTPVAVYLASEACTTTHRFYSQCVGRTARVFAAAVPGWQAHRQSAPSVEQVAEHWDAINDTGQGFTTPATPRDELIDVLSAG